MHIRIKRQQPAQIGRSLVEMLGVLAVIGILSVLGLVGFSYAMEKWRENETLNYYSKIVAGARTGNILKNQGWHTLYKLVDGYETQKDELEPQRIGMSEVISNVDIVPCAGGDCVQAPLKGPFNAFNRPRKGMAWDDSDEKEVEIWVNVQSPKAFTVHAQNLTMGACKKIVQADLGYNWAFQDAVRHVSEADEKNDWITPDALMDDVMAEALCLGAATQNGLVLWFGPYDCYTSRNCQIPPVNPTPVCGPESEDYCYTTESGRHACCPTAECLDNDGDGEKDTCRDGTDLDVCSINHENYCHSTNGTPECCSANKCTDSDDDGTNDTCKPCDATDADYCYTDNAGPVCCGNCIDDDGDGNGDRCGEIPPVICTPLSSNYCYSDDDGPHCCQSGACLDADADGVKDACACPAGEKWCSGDVNNPVCCRTCYDNNGDGVYESCGPDNERCDDQPTCTVTSDCEDENAICSNGCCVTVPECAEGEQLYCAKDYKGAPDCSDSYCIWSSYCTEWKCTAAELLRDPTLAKDVGTDENPGWRDRMGLGDSYARDLEIPMTGAMEGKYPYCSYALRIPFFGVSRCALVSYCDEKPVDIGNGMQVCPACDIYDNTTHVCVGKDLRENFDVQDGKEALLHYRPKDGPGPRCEECVDATDCGASGWLCQNDCCELEEICSSNMKCESNADCVVSQEVANKNGWETKGKCQGGCCEMVDCVDECAKKGEERAIGGGCCPPENSWYNCGNCAAQPHEMNSCGEYVPAAKACCDGPSNAPDGCVGNGTWQGKDTECNKKGRDKAPCCYVNFPDSNNQCCAKACLADGSVSSTNPASVCCNEGAGDIIKDGVCCKAGVAHSAHCCMALQGVWAPSDVTVPDENGVSGKCCMPVPGQTPVVYVPYGKYQAECGYCPAGETNPQVYPQNLPPHKVTIDYPVASAHSSLIPEGFVCCSDALGAKEAYMDEVTGQLSCCHPNSFVQSSKGNVFGPYQVGTCCSTGVTYTTSSGGNTGGSGTACCPTASVFTNTYGVSACCLDANGQLQKTYKDENGVEQCCQAPDLPYKNDKGQDDCCPAANVYTDSNNNKQCCSDGTIIKDGNGNQFCCPTEKLYTDSNNVQQCCLSGVVYTNDYGNQDCCPPEQWDATNEMCAIMPIMTTLPETDTPDSDTPGTDTPDTGTPDTGTPDTGTPDTGTPSSYTLETTTSWWNDDEDASSSSSFDTTTGTPETTTPNPYDTTTGTPNPYDTTTGTPNPYDTTTGTPNPYDTTTGTPNPYDTTTGTPDPYNTTTGTPNPYDSTTSTPNPYDTTTGTPNPYDTTTGTPNPYGTTTGTPNPYDTTTGTPDVTTPSGPTTTTGITTPTSTITGTPNLYDTTTGTPNPYDSTMSTPDVTTPSKPTTTSITTTPTTTTISTVQDWYSDWTIITSPDIGTDLTGTTSTTMGTPNSYDTMTTAPSWNETTTSLTRTATPTTTSLTRTATPTTTSTTMGTPNSYDTMTTAPSWNETTTSLTRTATPTTTSLTRTATPTTTPTTTGTSNSYDTMTTARAIYSGMTVMSGEISSVPESSRWY